MNCDGSIEARRAHLRYEGEGKECFWKAKCGGFTFWKIMFLGSGVRNTIIN
jgi:hypothetical protein